MFEDLTCVLFNGPSASGKTSTARNIAAPHGLLLQERHKDHKILWDHRALSAPLGEMFKVKTDTKGKDSESRQLWMLHQILNDLFPPNSINFNDFVELVYDAYSYPIQKLFDSDGNIVRDRDFMTGFSDLCHNLRFNIFADYLAAKIRIDYNRIVHEYEREADQVGALPWKNVVIVSDLRRQPELESFEKLGCNLIKIRFEMSDAVRDLRMTARDGKPLTQSQMSHWSQSFEFDNSIFDLVVDSSTMSLDEQTSMVKNFIINSVLP